MKLIPALLLVCFGWLVGFMSPVSRPRFEGSSHGGNNGAMKAYDDMTTQEHDDCAAFWAGGLQ